MYSLGLSNDGFAHILDQIFQEEMKENNEPKDVWIDRGATHHKQYHCNDKPPKVTITNYSKVRLNQPSVNPEWLVNWGGQKRVIL